MAHFYGFINGRAKSTASRLGTKDSGLSAVAASWDGCIRTYIWHDEVEKVDRFEVYQGPWNGAGCSNLLASGIVGQTSPACIES